jgi:hypothetical protein
MFHRLVSYLTYRLRPLFRRSAVEQELDEELRFHVDREIDKNVSAGMSPGEARTAALRALAASTGTSRTPAISEEST